MDCRHGREIHGTLVALGAVLSVATLGLAGGMTTTPYLTYASFYNPVAVSLLDGVRCRSCPTFATDVQGCSDAAQCFAWGKRAIIVVLALLGVEVCFLLPLQAYSFWKLSQSRCRLVSVEMCRLLWSLLTLSALVGSGVVQQALYRTDWCGMPSFAQSGFQFTTGYTLQLAAGSLAICSSILNLFLAISSCCCRRRSFSSGTDATWAPVGGTSSAADGAKPQQRVTTANNVPMTSPALPSKPMLHPTKQCNPTTQQQPKKVPINRGAYETAPLLL